MSEATKNKAIDVINAHRQSANEHFSVEPLEAEFPSFAPLLGHRALYIARAGDNEAQAFKWRGAMNAVANAVEQDETSFIVPSAGNHARGAVIAAREHDALLHVVVPTTAPHAKKEGLKNLWDSHKLTIHSVGDTFDESYEWALANGALGSLIHPYNNADVIAGQGTVADDILTAQPDVRHIVLPTGGGGLLAGVTARLDDLGRNDITVHGVQAEGSDSLEKSLAAGELRRATNPNHRFGGSAVQYIGDHVLQICQKATNLQLHTPPQKTVEAIIDLYQQDRTDYLRHNTPPYEPTSLVALGALHAIAKNHPNEEIVVIGTGHNSPLYQEHVPHRHTVHISK